MFYPVYLNLKGKQVVVIGGGEVAERKVESLLDTGASVAVVSPDVTPGLASLANSKLIELHRRRYVRGDCKGADLVLSATDDPEVSRAVWEEAKAAEILVNTADEPALCDFIMPAVIRRGDLTIAISTGGTSPALAARLREELSRILGPEYELLLELLAQVRPEIQQRIQDERARKALHYRILDSDVIVLLQQNDSDAAARRLREIIEDFACQEKRS
jgi:precorrin-2 dehydrogenase/sirohydrochlorin ferrochelatase